ncbi:peroxidase 5-like [Aristolochia californica]|uniref:peroxidase 5-like n=1 Tax=Aristolochia californica TaxID=171875 RepID=UPI0035DCBE01
MADVGTLKLNSMSLMVQTPQQGGLLRLLPKLHSTVAFVLGTMTASGNGEDCLKYDYYHETCPQAEVIIAERMHAFIQKDITVPSKLIRMHFHDCFVRGCDGSILINSTTDNQAEKDSPKNNPSLQGYEFIDQIKEALEYQCPGVVSCADILAYAARESVYESGNFEHYPVRGGRRDGRISRASDVLENIPPPTFEVDQLLLSFSRKGLSLEELVTLSGAHSIGVAHCSAVGGRQLNFNNTGHPDPTLDFILAKALREECPVIPGGDDPIVFMDRFTPTILDHRYYEFLLQNKGLFTSDQTLLTNELTRREVMADAVHPSSWEKKFVKAMIKMGEIKEFTDNKGEVRRHCAFVNLY